jgi:hypothetical protein
MAGVGSVGCEHYKRKSKFVVSKFNSITLKSANHSVNVKGCRIFFYCTVISGKLV